MSFEEEFDKIVRAKADEETYPFDERNWKKTSSLIDAERKASRMLKLQKFYFPALFIIGIGSASIVAYNIITPNEKTVSVTAQAPVSAIVNASTPSAHVDANLLNTEDAGREQTKTGSTENKSHNSVSEKSPSLNQITSNSTVESSKTPGDKTKSTAITKVSSAVLQPKNELPQLPLLDNVRAKGTESNQNKDSENGGIVTDESAAPSQIGKMRSDASLANTSTSEKSESEENMSAAPAELVSAETQQLTSEQLVLVQSNLPYETSNREVLMTPFTILSRYDDDYYQNNLKKKHFMNLEVGANYVMGWDTRNGKDAKGMNWFGGLNYGFYLTQKISLGIGLQAYNIGNIEQAFYVNEKKEYSFGSSTSYTVITSNDLYYLAVPLKFNYRLNTSNTIGFGVNAAYLMNASNTVSTYSVQQENGASTPVSTHNTGIYEGTRLTNLMLSAHYHARLNKRMSASAELNYGLTDIFENKGTITNKETPLGFRLSLQYTLFDK